MLYRHMSDINVTPYYMATKYPKVKFIAMTLLDTFSRGLLQSGELSGIIRLVIVRDPRSCPSPMP